MAVVALDPTPPGLAFPLRLPFARGRRLRSMPHRAAPRLILGPPWRSGLGFQPRSNVPARDGITFTGGLKCAPNRHDRTGGNKLGPNAAKGPYLGDCGESN